MNPETRYMEHRWGTRVELDARVELLTADGREVDAAVRNASLSGAFVETAASVPLLSRIAVRPLTDHDEELEACVVRVESNGIGLEWLEPGLHPLSTLLCVRHGTVLPARFARALQDVHAMSPAAG